MELAHCGSGVGLYLSGRSSTLYELTHKFSAARLVTVPTALLSPDGRDGSRG